MKRKRSTWGGIANVLLGVGVVYVIHRWIIPDLDFMPTPKFIFAMEKLALLLTASAFVFGEVQKYAKSEDEAGLRFRDVGVLLVAILGSGLIYLGLMFLAGTHPHTVQLTPSKGTVNRGNS